MALQPLLRKTHLYLGVFFAPLLLFFVVSGWYQTMNPDRRKAPEDAEAVWDRMRFVHAEALLPAKEASTYRTKPFRWFVAVMSAALILTTALGIYLAFRHSRRPWPVLFSLVLGVLAPLLLLWLGQQR